MLLAIHLTSGDRQLPGTVGREAETKHDVVLHSTVRDTGVGIPLDRQESVFEAFPQADGSVTRTYGTPFD
jgi:signal transduction histidine kinase